MARRLVAISLALVLWAIGGLLLFAAAGSLLSTMVHHVGSDGWLISALLAIGLGVVGRRLVESGRPPRCDEPRTHAPDDRADDEAMWRD